MQNLWRKDIESKPRRPELSTAKCARRYARWTVRRRQSRSGQTTDDWPTRHCRRWLMVSWKSYDRCAILHNTSRIWWSSWCWRLDSERLTQRLVEIDAGKILVLSSRVCGNVWTAQFNTCHLLQFCIRLISQQYEIQSVSYNHWSISYNQCQWC